tara:strand:- start:2736 stop:2939 length:204 start_codon:yes stop_codon:yes gene_type:complete
MAKRTFRNVTVQDKQYAWTVGKVENGVELKIWENKQIILRKELNYIDEVTTDLVAKVIEKDIILKKD